MALPNKNYIGIGRGATNREKSSENWIEGFEGDNIK